MSVARVLPCFEFSSNRRQAARQDLDLARDHYEQVCQFLDCTQPEDVDRFQAAMERLAVARERWLGAMER